MKAPALSPRPLIEISDLCRRVRGRDRPLLDVPNWSIQRGERISLQGPNGSGKTSLLRAIAMLDPCPGCSVRLDGRVVTSDWITDYRRQVIYLPQRATVVPTTVADNLRLPFETGGDRRAYCHERARRLLAEFEKPLSFLDLPADTLSGGERQIVSFVRAIQLDPQVILLDEPTASLDADAAARFERVLLGWLESADASADSRAMVLVSHDTHQLARLTDKRCRLADGRPIALTDPHNGMSSIDE